MIYVLVKGGVVEHCIGANEDQLQNISEMYPDHLMVEQVGGETVGWTYDGSEFYPPAGFVPEGSIRITRLAFLNRFTDAEAVGIDLASLGSTEPAAILRREMKRIDAAQYIDIADPALLEGLTKLEQFGLLSSGRAEQILNPEVTAKERYTG